MPAEVKKVLDQGVIACYKYTYPHGLISWLLVHWTEVEGTYAESLEPAGDGNINTCLLNYSIYGPRVCGREELHRAVTGPLHYTIKLLEP